MNSEGDVLRQTLSLIVHLLNFCSNEQRCNRRFLWAITVSWLRIKIKMKNRTQNAALRYSGVDLLKWGEDEIPNQVKPLFLSLLRWAIFDLKWQPHWEMVHIADSMLLINLSGSPFTWNSVYDRSADDNCSRKR